MFLVDTNVLSELRREERADRNVAAWAEGVGPSALYVSVVTIMEIEIGGLRLQRRDPAQGRYLLRWLETVIARFERRILSIDQTIARRCAALHVPDPRTERDALIAATALVHGLTVVTRNTRDFAPTGVATHNPWLAESAPGLS